MGDGSREVWRGGEGIGEGGEVQKARGQRGREGEEGKPRPGWQTKLESFVNEDKMETS